MGKPRSDSAWHGLSPAQQETLGQWLFEQNLGYVEVLERARKEFSLTASKTSLCYYYQRLARERVRQDLNETQAIAAAADGARLDLATLRGGAVKLIGKRLLDALLRPGEVKDLSALASLLLQNEQQEIQRAWLDLARDKYRFKASRAALKVLPMVDEMSQEEEERELARIEKIKRALFGDEVDKIQYPDHELPASPARKAVQKLTAFEQKSP